MKQENFAQTMAKATGASEQECETALEALSKAFSEAARKRLGIPDDERELPYSEEELAAKRDKTKVRTVAVHFDCEPNPDVWFDAKVAQTPNGMLGYDFWIEEEKFEEMKAFVLGAIEKYGQPAPSLRLGKKRTIERASVWTQTDIERCVRRGYKG